MYELWNNNWLLLILIFLEAVGLFVSIDILRLLVQELRYYVFAETGKLLSWMEVAKLSVGVAWMMVLERFSSRTSS